MDVKKTLIVKSLRELLTITACLSHKTQATDIQEEEIRMSINLPYTEGTQWKTMVHTQISKNKINFLHWKHFA